MSLPKIEAEVHGNAKPIQVGVSSLPPIDASVGIKDAKFEIGGILNQPLHIDLGPFDLVATGVETQPITVKAGLSLTGDDKAPVTFGLTGDKTRPVTFDATIAAGLDNIGLTLKGDPKNPVTLDLGLDDIKIDLGLDDINACLSLGITQIPHVQVHMPTSSCVGLSILGIPIFNLSFDGRWGLTTQDNPPRIFQSRHCDDGHFHDEAVDGENMPEDVGNMPDLSVSLDPEP
jgi:hypothetical protein